METVFLILMLLLWGVLLVLNLWVWQKGKGKGNLVMLVGAGIMMLAWLLLLTSEFPSTFVAMWLPLIGMIAFVGGFYLSVQPMVQAHIDALKKKLHDVTAEKKTEEKSDKGDAS